MYKRTTCDGVAVIQAFKPNGIHNAFLGNIVECLKDNNTRKEECKIVFIGQLRDPNGNDVIVETANKAGNMYPTDIIVIAVDDDASIHSVVSQIAVHMNSIANNECSDDWKFGTPFFINKGDATGNSPSPLNSYVLNYGCASVIRRIFEDCKTKEDLLNNPARAEIFKEIFGSEDIGLEAVNSIDEGFYVNL